MFVRRLLFCCILVCLVGTATMALADVPQLINYQGILLDDIGDPVPGPVNVVFAIWDADIDGDSLWSEQQTISPDGEGRFSVLLGSNSPIPDTAFADAEMYLSVKVEADPEMTPRQRLASVAYAYHGLSADYALYADSADAITDGGVDFADIGQNGAAENQIIKWDGAAWMPADDDTGTGGDNDWTLTGDVLYTAGEWGIARAGNILYGAYDSTHVNLGVACTTGNSERDIMCATVGGGRNNTAGDSYSTVSGGRNNTAGDYYATVPGGYSNTADGTSSFAAGNQAKAMHSGSFVWGDGTQEDFSSTGNNQFLIRASGGVGIGETAPAAALDVAGDVRIQGQVSIEGGSPGAGKVLTSDATGTATWETSTSEPNYWTKTFGVLYTAGEWGIARAGNVLYGVFNTTHVNLGVTSTTGISGSNIQYATVGGGYSNTAGGKSATIGGGNGNRADGDCSTAPGGTMNTAGGHYSFAAGRRAKAKHTGVFVWADATDADFSSTEPDQFLIRASGGVGIGEPAPAAALDIAGMIRIQGGNPGSGKILFSDSTGIARWGTPPSAWANNWTESGDVLYTNNEWGIARAGNTLYGDDDSTHVNLGVACTTGVSGSDIKHATVGGGRNNTASGHKATVGGGYANTASGESATVGGGYSNSASSIYATIPGGYNNDASGDYSFAAGRRAKANHNGCFIWADATDADYTSYGTNQFRARASGGVRFHTNAAATTGVYISAGGGSWTTVSDRNVKRNIRPVDGAEVLEKLALLEVSRWSYKSQDEGIEHIGPMAQDFYRLFGVGDNNTSISTIDPDGIALAAIQELHKKTQKIEKLEAQMAELQALVQKLLAERQ